MNSDPKTVADYHRGTMSNAAQSEALIERPMHPYDTEAGQTLLLPSRQTDETLDATTGRLTAKRRLYKGGYQNYFCQQCKTPFSAGVMAGGSTPAVMACQEPSASGGVCGGVAANIGRSEHPVGHCRAEWFEPNAKLITFYGKFDPVTWRHVQRGGLAYRPVQLFGCCACHDGIDRTKAIEWSDGHLCPACDQERNGDEPRVQRRRGQGRPNNYPETPSRNEPCHCGSGTKFKRCHGA